MYIDDLLPHAPLELCSYWGCGQVIHIKTKVSGPDSLEVALEMRKKERRKIDKWPIF